jgi:hypothetical protein
VRTPLSLTRHPVLRTIAGSAVLALALALCATAHPGPASAAVVSHSHVTASQTAENADAPVVHLRTDEAEQASPEMCEYFAAECIGSDTVGAILTAVNVAITLLAIVYNGHQGSGKDAGDVIIIIVNNSPSSEDYGDCIRAWGNPGYGIWDPCGEAGENWIEVPTDGQNALASEYYYNEGELTYLTVDTFDPPSDVLLEAASYDSANYRTWYFPVPGVDTPVLTAPASPAPAGTAGTESVASLRLAA